jgi:hypothetical protein
MDSSLRKIFPALRYTWSLTDVQRKKQLLYHISGWGFEKNIKKNERRKIIQQLGPEVHNPQFVPQNLKGRQLHKTKLNRWMRTERATAENCSDQNVMLQEIPGSVFLKIDFGTVC